MTVLSKIFETVISFIGNTILALLGFLSFFFMAIILTTGVSIFYGAVKLLFQSVL